MSQYSIQQSLGNASGVAVSPINADATLSTGVALNSSLWAGIGVFARGKPFTVLAVTESNYEDVLGEPLKPSSGSQFEPIRHVYEAIQQSSGDVVRAVPDDAKFPIIMFDESGEPAYSACHTVLKLNLIAAKPLLSTLMMVIRVFLLPVS